MIACRHLLTRFIRNHTQTNLILHLLHAAPILVKFCLKTQKSILNKVTKFQIPTPNRLGAIIEKPPGGAPPQGIGLTRHLLEHFTTSGVLGGGGAFKHGVTMFDLL